ncbi:MAG: hypothetical protein AAF481_13770 [Acidobacteriota bacterium]
MSDAENPAPRFPEIEVDLHDPHGHPTAMIAIVRKALQEAGHGDAARQYTHRALAAGPAELIALARQWVTVL